MFWLCVDTDYCMEHKDVGPCKTYYPFWYYDTVDKECIPFTYGGCLGNKNRFHSKEACVRTCGNGKGDHKQVLESKGHWTILKNFLLPEIHLWKLIANLKKYKKKNSKISSEKWRNHHIMFHMHKLGMRLISIHADV